MSPESLYIVPSDVLTGLRLLKKHRDEQAFIAGTAVLEFEARKQEIREKASSEEDRNLRLGAVLFAFDGHVEDCRRLVRASQESERALAEGALTALGLDFHKEELTIDQNNGVVLRLREGEWQPLERSV